MIGANYFLNLTPMPPLRLASEADRNSIPAFSIADLMRQQVEYIGRGNVIRLFHALHRGP